MNAPDAVVLDLSPNGLAIARNLGRRGLRVLALDRARNVWRSRTRYAVCRSCPDPAVAPAAFIDFLVGLARSWPTRPVLYLAADDYVECVSRYRQRLAPYYRYLLPDPALVEALLDKRQTQALMSRYGFPLPRSWTAGLGFGERPLPPDLTFPCLLKPARSYRFRRRLDRKAIMVRNEAELRSVLGQIQSLGPLLIQELIPGGDDCIYQVGFLLDPAGRLLGRFGGRKLLQYPRRFGSGALAVSESDTEALTLATRMVTALGLVGLCNVELKRDARDGSLKLMEIDPRLWLWHDLGRRAGVDLAYGYYRLLAGQPLAPMLHQQDGIKWVHELRAPVSAWAAWTSGERRLARVLGDFRRIGCTALFCWDDPLPFFRHGLAMLRERAQTRIRTGITSARLRQPAARRPKGPTL
ncbi:MAG TPA: hypothetical protein VIL95_06150 [Bacillota bacterium]